MAEDPFEEFFSVPTIEHPSASPDGTRVAYLHNDTGRPELHVVDAATGETQRLTDGDLRGHAFRSDFLWTPGSDGLYVSVVPDDDWHAATLQRFALDGGREIVHEYTGHGNPCSVHPNGESILFGSRPRDAERMPLRHLDLDSGESQIVSDCWQVRTAAYSPHGERAWVSMFTDMTERRSAVLENSSGRELSAGDVETSFVGWLDDRRAVYSVRDERASGAIRNVVEDTITFIGEDGDGDEEQPVGVLDGRVVSHNRNTIVLRDVETDETQRLEPDRSVTAISTGGERLAFCFEATDETLSALASWTADRGIHTLVQPAYGAVTPAGYTECEELTVEAEHGEYPIHVYHTNEEPAPVIAWVYGYTPSPVDHDVFQPTIQAFVSHGYTVAFPGSGAEPPAQIDGSETYAFSDAEHEDIAAVGRWLAEQSWCDFTAVLGHSLGGWNAAMQAVRYPKSWDAAISWQGPTDLVSHYGANGRPPIYHRCLGALDENEALWRGQSPVTHARDLGIPLLIYHGASDHHVPIEQARSLRDHLRAWGHERGTDFEYVEAPGEGHMTRAAEHDIRRWRRVREFLDQRL